MPLGVKGFLSDEGNLSFGQRSCFAISEPLECSTSVTTEALGGHYSFEKNGVGVGGKVKKDETPIYFSTSDFKNASLLTMKNKFSYLQTI